MLSLVDKLCGEPQITMDPEVSKLLETKAKELGVDLESKEFALKMDEKDPCAKVRQLFNYPKMKDLPEG